MTEANSATSSIVTVLNPVTLIYATLFEPKPFGKPGKTQGEPKFSASFVFTKDNPDFDTIKSQAVAVAQAKWPGRDVGGDWKAGRFTLPFSSGASQIAKKKAAAAKDGKEYDGRLDFLDGQYVLKTSSQFRSRFAVIENGKITPDLEGAALETNKSKFYNGVKCLIEINLRAYDGVGTGADGVTAYLNIITSLNVGERIQGGRSASEAFAGYAGKATAENPMKDEIPF